MPSVVPVLDLRGPKRLLTSLWSVSSWPSGDQALLRPHDAYDLDTRTHPRRPEGRRSCVGRMGATRAALRLTGQQPQRGVTRKKAEWTRSWMVPGS
ncbi:MAG: hypothetical protein ACI9OJ_000301 [Myxococcota bacterium]|jgi:hypothetical protein